MNSEARITSVAISINFTVKHLTSLLSEPPDKLHKLFYDRATRDNHISDLENDVENAIFVTEQLQEALNCILDGRKRLLRLNMYRMTHEESIDKEQEMGIRTREEISPPLEEDPPKPQPPFTY